MTTTYRCPSCGQEVTIENLGALISVEDADVGKRAYCHNCKMKVFDDYSDWQALQLLH